MKLICQKHPKYRAKKNPRGQCPRCWFIFGRAEALRDVIEALDVDISMESIQGELKPGLRYVRAWFEPKEGFMGGEA